MSHLLNHGIKDLPPKQVARNSQLAVEETNRGVIRILRVEARKVEHHVWRETASRIRSWLPCGEIPTVLALTDVGKLIRITKGVHKGCKTCGVKVDGMIGEKCPNELLESQIPDATV